jgi:hypothetical protein
MLRAGDDFAMFYPVTRNVSVDPVEVVPTGFGETIGDSKGPNLRVAPGKHQLAADAVLELPLVLDDENPGALLGHAFGQGRAAQAAACDG